MAPNLKERLLAHLEVFSGGPADWAAEKDLALPLFLRERYAVFSTRLFGRKALLALEKEGWEAGSPGEYGRHAEALQLKLGGPVVLVLPSLPSYARNRMVRMGIPFVVPGSQVFLPTSVVDLRERHPRPNPKRRETLSPAAQCTVLFHLLRGPLGGIPLKVIAEKTRYSPMMMTKVKDELEAGGICEVARSGRAIALEFPTCRRSLWEQAKPQLTSPARKMLWVRWSPPGPRALLAGMSALSQQTMIAADRLPTHALTRARFQEALEQGVCAACHDAEDATGRIEIWPYEPELLSDGQLVDPLSLYLSLQDSGDERVQQQLGPLIEGVEW